MIVAAVLTYKPLETGRLGQLALTCDTLTEADRVLIIDNGSGADELQAIREVLAEDLFSHDGPLHTCGHGTNLQARYLAGIAQPGDICVLSDDDMMWRPGWRAKLEDWWSRVPEEVILTGCHLEPRYPWNSIVGVDEYPALWRDSTGAASWTYRAESHHTIFPIPQRVQGEGDVHACRKLRDRGLLIAQLDLADHVGEASSWGNRTAEMFGPPNVEPIRALLAEAAA